MEWLTYKMFEINVPRFLSIRSCCVMLHKTIQWVKGDRSSNALGKYCLRITFTNYQSTFFFVSDVNPTRMTMRVWNTLSEWVWYKIIFIKLYFEIRSHYLVKALTRALLDEIYAKCIYFIAVKQLYVNFDSILLGQVNSKTHFLKVYLIE